LNAHERMGIRVLYWGQFYQDDILEFEIVDYFSSPIIREGNWIYHVYYAIVTADNLNLGIIAGDEIELHLSYKTYCNALSFLPTQMKTPCLKKFAEGKNLFMKISKKNSREIVVHYQEPREPTEQQLKEAESLYKMVSLEHGLKIK
ncbi:MAG: hypothetical protein AABY22_25615, partial [Nanoarchaeota archaeon]